ncbi:conserved hypothetical protein [Histoplasma capsulatum H143]|uniref:DUF7587 domain-containing protein n=1 Tax=Ajellomyces capsulatus (strain H143) TaxID=544712 RepID=C6H8N2_AJECH|nr:conserved hypothetical protein [Histoplasma capsulatum H143]
MLIENPYSARSPPGPETIIIHYVICHNDALMSLSRCVVEHVLRGQVAIFIISSLKSSSISAVCLFSLSSWRSPQSLSKSDMDSVEKYPSFLDFGRIKIPRHKWTDQQRVVLCVLRQFYALEKKDEAEIFNHIFEPELEDFENGLPVTTVNTQCHHMMIKNHPIWVSVNLTSLSDDEYKECRRIIELASMELDIYLRQRSFDDGQVNPNSDEDVNPHESLEKPEPVTEPGHSLVARLPRTSIRLGYGGAKTPQILYRFFNSQSIGINTPKYFACGLANTLHHSLYNQHDIEAMAKTHLSRVEVNSPFISTFSALLPCVHRMLTRSQNSGVSIVDASKLDQNGIFSAGNILRKDPLSSDITPGYSGWSEWLIWKEIPESCIVCTITESELLAIAEMHHDIGSLLQIQDIKSFKYNRKPLHRKLRNSSTKFDKAAGETVGKFLRGIGLPVEYTEQVAMKIAYGWRFTRTAKYDSCDDFLEGVRLGYGSAQLDNTPTIATPPMMPEKPTKKQEFIVINEDTDVEVYDDYRQEVVVIEDDEDEVVEVVIVEDSEADEMDVVVVEKGMAIAEAKNHDIGHQIIDQEENDDDDDDDDGDDDEEEEEEDSLDRLQDELRHAIESESKGAPAITFAERVGTTYRWINGN